MLAATTTGSWEALFGAVMAAGAAFAGLLFVAVSINVREILRYPSLPTRAAETLILLVGTLIGAGVALVPSGAPRAVGVPLLAVSLVTWIVPTVLQVRSRSEATVAPRRSELVRGVAIQAPGLLLVVGSVMLVAGSATGFDVVAAGMLVAFAAAALNAWVLLVEILR
jgi:modulator of FtsH protease